MSSRKKVFYFFIFIVLLEITLRAGWGFGTPVLYIEDPAFEYIYAPNQNVCRFGQLIRTNRFCMRSDNLSESDSARILFIGDSVINGGTQTDNDKLASTILSHRLSKTFNKKINLLNISAGSWGPDNAAAYLKKYGTFNASIMVLVFSSHDAFDNMTHEKIVGIDPSYPDTRPISAIIELVTRYLIPSIKDFFHPRKSPDEYSLMINKNGKVFNPGWSALIKLAKDKNMKLIIVLHAERNEANQHKYNTQGQMILDSLSSWGISPYKDIDDHFSPGEYRDYIHLDDEGQQHLAQFLFGPISAALKN